MTRETWNRATKTIVIASTLAAALAEWVMAARLWDALWPATIIAAIVAAVAARRARGTALTVVLLLIYLAPAGFLLLNGNDHFSYEIVWIAPLLAILVADREARAWSLPSPWRLPLVAWALVVSVSWPIVALREFDFSPWLLNVVNVPNTGIGVSPEEVVMWTAYIVLGHNVGLLWIDALFRWYGRVPIARFRIEIVAPLVAGVGIASAVGHLPGIRGPQLPERTPVAAHAARSRHADGRQCVRHDRRVDRSRCRGAGDWPRRALVDCSRGPCDGAHVHGCVDVRIADRAGRHPGGLCRDRL